MLEPETPIPWGTPVSVKVIHGFVLSVLLVGNLVVTVAVSTSSKLKTISNYFVFSLAVVDCVMGLASLPGIYFLRILDELTVLCHVYFTIVLSVCFISVLHVLAINVDRYIAITRPLRYPSIVTHKKAIFVILFIWIFGSGSTGVCFRAGFIGISSNRCSPDYTPAFALVSLLGLFLVPFTATTILYIHIYRLTVKHIQTITFLSEQAAVSKTPVESTRTTSGSTSLPQDGEKRIPTPKNPDSRCSTPNDSPAMAKKSRKTLRVISIILCTLGISWGTFYTAVTVVAFNRNEIAMSSVTTASFFYITFELLYISAAANPVIYAFYSPEFKAEFQKLLCRKCKANK